MVAKVIHKVETVIFTVLALQPERRHYGLFDFEFRFGFPFLAAVERRNGAVVVTMVSVRLENAGRYLPDVPERIVSVGVTTCLDTCLDLAHVIPLQSWSQQRREQP